MVSDLETFTFTRCEITKQKNWFLGKFCKVIQQGSRGYTTRIRRLYNKDQEVMFSNAIIESLQKTFAYKGCKITAFSFSPANFALLATIRISREMLCLPYAGF